MNLFAGPIFLLTSPRRGIVFVHVFFVVQMYSGSTSLQKFFLETMKLVYQVVRSFDATLGKFLGELNSFISSELNTTAQLASQDARSAVFWTHTTPNEKHQRNSDDQTQENPCQQKIGLTVEVSRNVLVRAKL